jgi:Leucine-rich repeat (LRR) protein
VLKRLGAQNSNITPRALESLLQISTLEHLDLEASDFNDSMATMVAESKSIKHLDIGASKITAKGLRLISTMQQLQSLDIWSVDIGEKDIELLSNLPNLEYLSIGGFDNQTKLTSKGVLPRIKEISTLKRLWLDGIALTSAEKTELGKRYEYFRT